MLVCEGMLFTLAQTCNELKVWDIESWVNSKYTGEPKCILILNKVFSFDIRPFEND